MVDLSAEDRRRLLDILKTLPLLNDPRSRTAVLENADLGRFVPMIDFSGSQYVVANDIITHLANFGRVSYEHEALGRFLNWLKDEVGVHEQEVLDDLLIKYDMMTPVVRTPEIPQWRGSRDTEEVLEKVIGENTLRPIAFLAQGLHIARSVGYVGVHNGTDRWSGTGFLVAPDVVLTNHHVVPDAGLLPNVLFRLNYEENFRGEAQTSTEYRADPTGLFHANKSLDYAFFTLSAEAGNEWGWLGLAERPVRQNERVNIIQHPHGYPKHIALQNNYVEYVNSEIVQYVTATQKGSSGSPVLNDAWEVVALHHAGGQLPEPESQRRYFRNEGILISRILADVPPELKSKIAPVSR